MVDLLNTYWVNCLQEYPEIPCVSSDIKNLPSWRYMPAEAPPLVELKTRYGLADQVSGMAELPAALRLLAWAYAAVEHDGCSINPDPRNSLNILDGWAREKRAVNCRMKAILLNEIYLSFGYRSRYITCMPAVEDGDCHVIVMVYITSLGRWITVDPTFNTYFTDPDGTIINIFEVHRIYRDGMVPSLHHIEKPMNAPLYCGVECSSYDEFYLLYMSKNCFRFACPVVSEFDYETRPDAQFIYLSPPGYDTLAGRGYDLARSIHDASPFLIPPL